MDEIEFRGNKIEELPDGGVKITTADGRSFVMNKDGNMKIDLQSIKSVGFENIVDLKSHVIMRDGDLTVHKAEFHDGGRVTLAFTSQGKLVEFTGYKIGQTITKDNEIIIRSSTAAKTT
ncbi:hypothetical protein [Marinimicrobium sp. ABcell2]|uniref:hypothetical protein n=1 Tax=Marinimicrobium sp. ABcell2 TaxID=3069751 RepID=UPI0027AE5ED9|nr:hypothetical protein [Marinimicrobium sp. ABcell2]MDQ2077932.1 hypothetical protein [Marinimicrobium sp. ABcell2]